MFMLGSVAALSFMHSLVRQIYESTDYEITALQVSVWRFTISALVLWLYTILAYRGHIPVGWRRVYRPGRDPDHRHLAHDADPFAAATRHPGWNLTSR